MLFPHGYVRLSNGAVALRAVKEEGVQIGGKLLKYIMISLVISLSDVSRRSSEISVLHIKNIILIM